MPKASGGKSTLYVSFNAPIDDGTAQALLNLLVHHTNKGVRRFYLLFSTEGGMVNSGIDLYNKLRSLPAELVAHNMGHVDSIGNCVFLAADERYASPHSRFMFHGVGRSFPNGTRLEERQAAEILSSLQNDHRRIGGIMIDRTSITADEVRELFLTTGFLGAQEACDKGIVQGVCEAGIPEGAPIIQFVYEP